MISSGAAGVGGGAASGAAAGALFGPWGAVAGAVLGGVLGGFGAAAQNRKIKQASAFNQRNINTQELNLTQGVMQQNAASAYQFSTNQAANAVGSFNDSTRSGASLNAAFASNSGQQIQGTVNANTNMQNQLNAYELQKQQIARGAQNSETPIASGVASGATQGFSIGSSIGSAVSGFAQLDVNQSRANMQDSLSGQINEYNNSMGPPTSEEEIFNNQAMDQLQFLNQGGNPYLLAGPNASVVTAPFSRARELYQTQMGAAVYSNSVNAGLLQAQARYFNTYYNTPLQGNANQSFYDNYENVVSPFMQFYPK